MKLNCDLGEGFGAWQMTDDEKLMPYIHMANIACGFHAGDPMVMARTLACAAKHQVAVGAHPAYPDLQGFGRRSMQLGRDELIAILHYQIGALQGMARCQGLELSHIKPHGALYNDMMQHTEIFTSVLQAVADFPGSLPLVVQATPEWQIYQQMAGQMHVSLSFEAFADRCYQDDGKLLPRSEPCAVLSDKQMLAQVEQLFAEGTVTTVSGLELAVQADTLCVHGDTPAALNGLKQIHQRLAT